MEQEYINLISEIVMSFNDSILDSEKEKQKLIQAFRKYMESELHYIINSNYDFVSKDQEFIKKYLERVAERVLRMDVNTKKQNLLEDKSFQQIRNISLDIFELAQRKKIGEKVHVEFNISSKIKEMDELLENVASYNKEQAENFISDAILDLKYICENEENMSSLRLYHFMQNQKPKDDEEER